MGSGMKLRPIQMDPLLLLESAQSTTPWLRVMIMWLIPINVLVSEYSNYHRDKTLALVFLVPTFLLNLSSQIMSFIKTESLEF